MVLVRGVLSMRCFSLAEVLPLPRCRMRADPALRLSWHICFGRLLV